MGTRVGSALLAILVSAILARLLDPENLGYYFLIFSVVTISSNLVRAGQGIVAIRLIAEAEGLGQLGRARQTALLTLFGVSAAAVLFALVFYFFLGDWLFADFFSAPAILGLSGLVALWIVIVGIRTQVAFIFRGMHAVRLAATFNGFLSSLVTLILFVYLFTQQAEPQLWEVVGYSIAGAFAGLLLSLVFLRARLSKFRGEGSIRASEIGSIALPLFLLSLTNIVLTQGDMVLAGNLLGEIDIAFYGVALRLKGLVILPMFVLGTVMSPLIAKLYAQNEKKKLEKIMRLSSTIAVVPFTLIMIFLLLTGDSIVAWIFGEAYRDAYPILMTLFAGLFISAIMGSGQQLMTMSGHERMLLPIRIAGGLFAIVGGILAAPSMGIIGIALSFALATAGINIAITLKARKLTGISCYIYSPAYFLSRESRQELTQELRSLVRESLARKRGKQRKGHKTIDEE